MTDTFAGGHGTANHNPGVAAISRLADRLAAVAPPLSVLELTNPAPMPKMSPAVAAGLATSAALAARADRRARRSRSITGTLLHSFVTLCSFIPYALVALALRLMMARVFFFDGQARIEGPHLSQSIYGFDFSVILPLQVKAETFSAFLQYTSLPVPPMLAAYAVSYAEFALPIMLVLGFGTRIAALGLLAMTVLIQLYVTPQDLWSAHVYWAAILLVLLSRGPGQLSIDHFIRLASRH